MAALDTTTLKLIYDDRVAFLKAINLSMAHCVGLGLSVNDVAKAQDIWAAAFWHNVWPLDLVARHKCVQRKWQFRAKQHVILIAAFAAQIGQRHGGHPHARPKTRSKIEWA